MLSKTSFYSYFERCAIDIVVVIVFPRTYNENNIFAPSIVAVGSGYFLSHYYTVCENSMNLENYIFLIIFNFRLSMSKTRIGGKLSI